jgi:hypothetical protein
MDEHWWDRLWKLIASRGWMFWVIEICMVVLAGYNFWLAAQQWGITQDDPTTQVGAAIIAGTTELGLLVFLHLLRENIYSQKLSKKQRFITCLLWGVLSAGGIGISLYVNQLYFSDPKHWKDTSGNQGLDLWIRSGWPMILLIGGALVPPKVLKKKTKAEIQEEYDLKDYEQERRQQLEDRRRAAAKKEALEKEQRRREREQEEALQIQMVRIAGPELAKQFEVIKDGEFATDWLGLKAALQRLGKWGEHGPIEQSPADPNRAIASVSEVAPLGPGQNTPETTPAERTQPGMEIVIERKPEYNAMDVSRYTGIPYSTVVDRARKKRLPCHRSRNDSSIWFDYNQVQAIITQARQEQQQKQAKAKSGPIAPAIAGQPATQQEVGQDATQNGNGHHQDGADTRNLVLVASGASTELDTQEPQSDDDDEEIE